MTKDDWIVGIFVGSVVVGFFALIIAAIFISPYFEMKAYNRVTGSHVTYWDAFNLELRVQTCIDADSKPKQN